MTANTKPEVADSGKKHVDKTSTADSLVNHPEVQSLMTDASKKAIDTGNQANPKADAKDLTFDTAKLFGDNVSGSSVDPSEKAVAAGKKDGPADKPADKRADQPDGKSPDDGKRPTERQKAEKLPDGSTVMHSKSGDVITSADGTTTTYKDRKGNFLMSHTASEAGGLSKIGDSKGGTISSVTGERKEMNFKLREPKHGPMVVSDADGKNPKKFPDDAAVKPGRDALLDRAGKEISDPVLQAKFKADMIRFENRAKEAKLTPDQVKDTYKAINELMDPKTEGKVPLADRVKLAEQVMAQAATPTGIDQGFHNTCNITTVEIRAFSKAPEKAADVVKQVAMTGEYKATNGQTTDMSAKLTPDAEATKNPPGDGKRSYASQLFQIATVNATMQSQGKDRDYSQVAPDAGKGDTGERLMDRSKNPPELVDKSPLFNSNDIADAYRLVTGSNEKGFVLENARQYLIKEDPGVNRFNGKEELAKALTDAKKDGRLPLILSVNAGNEPFLTEAFGGVVNGGINGHVVTITDFDPKTGMAKMDNQWGSRNDHIEKPIHIDQLFNATMEPQDGKRYPIEQRIDKEFPGLNKFEREMKIVEGLGKDVKPGDISKAFYAAEDLDKAGNLKPGDMNKIMDTMKTNFDKFNSSDQGTMMLIASMGMSNHLSENDYVDMYQKYVQKTGLTREKADAILSLPKDQQESALSQLSRPQSLAIRFLDWPGTPERRQRMLDSIPHQSIAPLTPQPVQTR